MADASVPAAGEFEKLRWWFLRWGPRADSGVVLAGQEPDGPVHIDTLCLALPVLAMSGDFAPLDMQYRMHRELLWTEATGLWAESGRSAPGAVPSGSIEATQRVADAVARALMIGGDAVPSEMRGRWARQLAEMRALLRGEGLHRQ